MLVDLQCTLASAMSVVTVVEVFVLFGVGWCCFWFGSGVRCAQFVLFLVLAGVLSHTSQVSRQLLLRDIQALEVLDVNVCARICWVQRRGSVPAVERWSLAHSDCRSSHLGSSWVWNVFVQFFRSAFPLAAGREGTGMLVAWICKRAAFLQGPFLF